MESLIVVSECHEADSLAEHDIFGFEIPADICSLVDAVPFILSRSPSLVIIDGSIPSYDICNLIDTARAEGFTGRFFVSVPDNINRAASSGDTVLDDIFSYIDHKYTEPIRLEAIASHFGYNSAYLGKIFKKAAGMSFNSYIDKLRIEYSLKLLESTDMKVYEIARKVGYKSVDYFHKKFRAITDESPAEYRKRLKTAYK